MTVMLHDKGLSTDIDWQNKDYSGKTINSRYRSQFYRMRKWQKRSRVSNATERNLAMALAELDRMASRLELPKTVREAAAVNYKKAVDKRLIRGRSIEGVAAASFTLHVDNVAYLEHLTKLDKHPELGEKRSDVRTDLWFVN